jgi:SecD/SecF fusion protein
MKKYLSWKILALILMTLFLLWFDSPNQIQSKIVPFTPESILNKKVHLGLDLQGGSQLDYKIDLRRVPSEDRESIIDGVLNVIEKRVNNLGISEPNIYTSTIGDETHIIVEIAENTTFTEEDIEKYLNNKKAVEELNDDEKKHISLEKAKETVGKTIQLEFKEKKESLDPKEKDQIKENATNTLERINTENFSIVAKEEAQANPGKVRHEEVDFRFASDINDSISDVLKTLEANEVHEKLIETGGTYTLDSLNSSLVEDTALAIVKLIEEKEEIRNEKEVSVSHILLSFKDATSADASITRTEEEAYELAKELLAKLNDEESPAKFEELAKEYSDDLSNKEEGGKLEDPVSKNAQYATEFIDASLLLEDIGDLSEITKTQFGYHIIKADKIETDVKEKQYKYELLSYSTIPDPWKDTGLTGEHFVRADLQTNEFLKPFVSIQFNEQGAKLFEELTEKNIGKQIAIFVGGELISAPKVNTKISGGSAIIEGQFSPEEAKNLARDLNTGAIPAPIILTGEYTIGATLGQEALTKSVKAGAIGFFLVILFMILIYRLPGVVASFAMVSYVAILIALIKSNLSIGFALLLSLFIFFFLIFKIINNKDTGWEKFMSFVLACAGFFFFTYLLSSPVTMTLAGIAGIIMSIGMAVDANVLIFERVKEELKEGKTLKSAVDSGFIRAWSAIRDSNFTTLLTCAILFYFGSSIIRGFAFNLAAGILVSMFSAIIITRTFLYAFIGTKVEKKLGLFAVSTEKKGFNFDWMKYAKLWVSIGSIVIISSISIISVFGLNLGIDFKGGSLMEVNFEQSMDKEEFGKTFESLEEEVNSKLTTTENIETDENETAITAIEVEKADLSNPVITNSGETGFVIKLKNLSPEAHAILLELLKEKYPDLEESRFTSIGPTVGKTLLNKALIAIMATLVMIITYLAIAFRRVTKQVRSWKFGLVAIVALFHDVLFTVAVFVILGKLFGVELDALFITALLTVLGYSVNDTIVVFDRFREKLILEKGEDLYKITNKSLNETLSRSINTTFTTLLTLIAVLVLGSQSIFYFILALTVGIAIGTYSSIFVSSPLIALWQKWENKK